MKRLSVFSLVATAAFAQTPPAPVAAAPVAPAAAPTTSGNAAPFAPISGLLLQGNPAAPAGIGDVLVAPHASAGLKSVGFNWAQASSSEAYIVWNKYFAAAKATPAKTSRDIVDINERINPNTGNPIIGANGQPVLDTTFSIEKAQTEFSLGYMTSALGFGATVAYHDTLHEDAAPAIQQRRYYSFSQLKLFASIPYGGGDLYGSLVYGKPGTGVTQTISELTEFNQDGVLEKKSDVTLSRSDSLMLSVGMRKHPAADVEGMAWNATIGLGEVYQRVQGSPENATYLANIDAQLGYIFITDGISLLPGVAASWHHANGKGEPDYSNSIAVTPSAAVIVPVFERWTLKGGAAFTAEQTLNDSYKGDHSVFDDHTVIGSTTGSLGLRYARDRWAVEAQVANSFLKSGPYFISGQSPAGESFLASLGFTLNLK